MSVAVPARSEVLAIDSLAWAERVSSEPEIAVIVVAAGMPAPRIVWPVAKAPSVAVAAVTLLEPAITVPVPLAPCRSAVPFPA